MEINYYKVTVKHDQGRTNIYTAATSEESAKDIIEVCEACPRSAIKSVKLITKRQFLNATTSKP